MINPFLQIEIIGPQTDKLVWIILAIIAIALLAYYFSRKPSFKMPSFKNGLIIKAEKNRVYHPTVIHIKIENKTKKSIIIEHPVVRFKRRRNTKAYKIKAVNARNIYPLYLESGKTHHLPVALEPFYDYDHKLKKFSRLRVEFKYNKGKEKKSKYLLLKPTLFRSNR
jgi:hypothetical protein